MPNDLLQQTGHANEVSSWFSAFSRVSRLLSVAFGEGWLSMGRAGKMRVAFKIFAGAFTQRDSRCEQAAEFASGLAPGRLITISVWDIGVIVWYWVETSSFGEQVWQDKYPGALACAHWYRDLLTRFCVIQDIRYLKKSINIWSGGGVHVAVFPRVNDRAQIWIRQERDLAEAVTHLSNEGITVTPNNDKWLVLTVGLQQLKDKQSAHEWIAQRVCP